MDFASVLEKWYEEHGRELPWRETGDPYAIWVSEVILQQTRVAQGLGYYERFMGRFPDVRSLAEAEEDEVMRMWQGLGYYSRARNMCAAAREVVERYGGEFPRGYAEVRGLKGIGDYTAAAVCSFAWGMPYAVVDGNVYRVLSRVFGVEEAVDTGKGKRIFGELADELLDRKRPALYNQAIMDFGALCCTPKVPGCEECPLEGMCVARSEGRVGDLPVKGEKGKVKERFFHYVDVRCGEWRLLRRREGRDIWRNLYEYPLIETEETVDWEEVAATEVCREWLEGAGEVRLERVVEMPKHVLSHRVIYARFYVVKVERFSDGMAGFVAVKEEELEKYAVSRLIEMYREREQE